MTTRAHWRLERQRRKQTTGLVVPLADGRRSLTLSLDKARGWELLERAIVSGVDMHLQSTVALGWHNNPTESPQAYPAGYCGGTANGTLTDVQFVERATRVRGRVRRTSGRFIPQLPEGAEGEELPIVSMPLPPTHRQWRSQLRRRNPSPCRTCFGSMGRSYLLTGNGDKAKSKTKGRRKPRSKDLRDRVRDAADQTAE
jgi:hypothetical protein